MVSVLVELFGSHCSRDRGGREPSRGAAEGFREEAGRALHCLLKDTLLFLLEVPGLGDNTTHPSSSEKSSLFTPFPPVLPNFLSDRSIIFLPF